MRRRVAELESQLAQAEDDEQTRKRLSRRPMGVLVLVVCVLIAAFTLPWAVSGVFPPSVVTILHANEWSREAVDVRWNGMVVAASGLEVEPDDLCTLEARRERRGEHRRARLRVQLWCGDSLLYERPDWSPPGHALTGCVLTENPTALSCVDRLGDSGPTLTVDTASRLLRFSSERGELRVALNPYPARVRGAETTTAAHFGSPLDAVVTASRGDAPSAGARCDLNLSRRNASMSGCHVSLRCDDWQVYGDGPADCEGPIAAQASPRGSRPHGWAPTSSVLLVDGEGGWAFVAGERSRVSDQGEFLVHLRFEPPSS